MHDPQALDHAVRGREIALLTNPTSGKGKGARHRDAALVRLRESGFVVRNLQGRDADEAADLARGCVADGVEALVVCGGDGLVHLGVQAVAGTGVPLGRIPSGTGYDVARFARQVIPDLPVLYVSGEAAPETFMAYGVPGSGFIEKPFRPDDLLAALLKRLKRDSAESRNGTSKRH